MVKDLRHIDISDLPELLDIAREVQRSQQPSVLQGDGGDLAMVIPLTPAEPARPIREQALEAQIWADAGTTADPWASYQPERMLQALPRSAGALRGIERDVLLRDLEDAREQETPGRPS